MKITEKGGRWFDENNNSWATEVDALRFSPTLFSCNYCRDCKYCNYCSYCISCIDCNYCRDCKYCRDCIDCKGCINFPANPERIISPIMGSRNEQTTIYWTQDKTYVVCGCFSGTLAEFEAVVNKTHGTNEHGIAYKAWIARVRQYANLP